MKHSTSISTGAATHANSSTRAPTHLPCKFCSRRLPADQFSQNQLLKYENAKIYGPAKRPGREMALRCKGCTPKTNTHLTCSRCHKHLPLDRFAKAQRRNADHARCHRCVAQANDESGSEDFSQENDSDVLIDDMRVTLNKLSISSNETGDETAKNSTSKSDVKNDPKKVKEEEWDDFL